MSFKAFLKSKSFLLTLFFAIAITVVIVVITIYSIRIYTNHGESLLVPDLLGMELEKVDELLTENDLMYEISDSVYFGGAEPGAVVDQVPVAGFRVKEGRTIFLTICANAPEQVPMPKLTDISLRQATNILRNVGLVIGNVRYVSSEYPNLVLSQKLDGKEIVVGTMTGKGSQIDLTVGQSMLGEMTTVPNLFGATLEQAEGEITSLFLNVGAVIYDDSVLTLADSLDARIWQQRPESSSQEKIEQGTSIDLWLTADQEILYPETDSEEIENAGTENNFF